MSVSVVLACDGSGSVTGSPGGWAYILQAMDIETGEIVGYKEGFGGAVSTSNNRMELTSLLMGLHALNRPSKFSVVSDSEYVLNAWRENWIAAWEARDWRKVKNTDLWKQLIKIVEPHEIDWQWVRGHTGHPLNERCDSLAGDCRKAVKMAIEAGSLDGLDFNVDRTELPLAPQLQALNV